MSVFGSHVTENCDNWAPHFQHLLMTVCSKVYEQSQNAILFMHCSQIVYFWCQCVCYASNYFIMSTACTGFHFILLVKHPSPRSSCAVDADMLWSRVRWFIWHHQLCLCKNNSYATTSFSFPAGADWNWWRWIPDWPLWQAWSKATGFFLSSSYYKTFCVWFAWPAGNHSLWSILMLCMRTSCI
jgi:hypothetical protein